MRNGKLDREDKARAVLTRIGRPGSEVAHFSDAEVDRLAAAWDTHVAPEEGLRDTVHGVIADRDVRAAAAKAVVGPDDPADRPSLVRNKKGAARVKQSAPSAPASTEAPAEPTGDATAQAASQATSQTMAPHDAPLSTKD